MILYFCLLLMLMACGEPVIQAEPADPPAEAVVADDGVTRILNDVDAQSASLRDFSAGLRLDSLDGLSEETEQRFGRVFYTTDQAEPPVRRAAVVLERSMDVDGRVRERLEHYVYANGVLSDYDHEAKKLTRRQLVQDGELRDPLRLGEGPIPIPIGQRKVDILKSFTVHPAPNPPQELVKDPSTVEGLHLVPRPGTLLAEKDRITFIDLWIDRTTKVPVAVSMQEADGDRISARFFKPKMNAGIVEADRAWLDAPEVDPRVWRIESR